MQRRRKIAVTAALVLAIVGLTLWALRPWLAERAFQRALDNDVGVDKSLALGDGLHAYVCGSGSPLPDATRAGPCLAVIAGNQAFVFDSGSGSARKLQRMGFPIHRLQAVFLTHLHSDHIDGMGELLLQAWIAGGRDRPLPVLGPARTDEVVAGLMQAYRADQGFRIAHHGPQIARPGGFGATAQIIALPDGAASAPVWNRAGVRITAIRVDHDPVSPAFGYRIDYKGRAIAFSGDTAYAPGFVAAARKADLMVHEAMNKQMVARLGDALRKRGNRNAAQIMSDIQDYHATPEDAARAAREAGVRELVLTHLVPAPPARLIEPMFMGKAPQIFRAVRLAHDGMIVSLPADSEAVTFSEGL